MKDKIIDYYLYFFVLCISVLFIGLRYEVGADYTEYSSLFYSADSTRFEPLSNIIFELFRYFGFTYNSLSLFLFVITVFLFTLSIKGLQYKTLLLVSFIFFLFVPLTSTIRQGLSLPFFILAIINHDSIKKYILFSLLGSLFHASALILLPLYFVKKIRMTKALFLILLCFSLILGYLNPIGIIIDLAKSLASDFLYFNKLLTYSTKYDEPMSISAQVYRLGFIVILLIIWDELDSSVSACFAKNIYLVMFMLTLIFKDNGVLINRLTFSTNITVIYILSCYLTIEASIKKKALIATSLVLYFSFNYYKFVYTDLRHSVEKAYIPYKNGLFLDENK
ncbi:EpsG family protein [Vibrio sp.]|uniref:EpsG family protein n=1 Tax=Vibrio sp. TaxID=678 RepID=UPI00311D369A